MTQKNLKTNSLNDVDINVNDSIKARAIQSLTPPPRKFFKRIIGGWFSFCGGSSKVSRQIQGALKSFRSSSLSPTRFIWGQ